MTDEARKALPKKTATPDNSVPPDAQAVSSESKLPSTERAALPLSLSPEQLADVMLLCPICHAPFELHPRAPEWYRACPECCLIVRTQPGDPVTGHRYFLPGPEEGIFGFVWPRAWRDGEPL